MLTWVTSQLLLSRFQSPCGEVVVKDAVRELGNSLQEFQSPCGEVVVKAERLDR